MGDYLKLFETHSEYETYSGGEMLKPNVSYCEDNNEVHYNPWTWADTYLTTVAREDGTISFNILSSMGTDKIESISYSTDNGSTWTTTVNQNNKEDDLVISVNVNTGDTILWKGTATQTGYFDEYEEGDYVGSFFSSSCEFDAKGNVMSLLYGDNFKGKVDLTGKDGAFNNLFSNNSNVVNAESLSLPATTLAQSCYYYMFNGCTALTTAPVLPATTLAQSCYGSMFDGCTALTTTPVLPATTLAVQCYYFMFRDCTSLTTAPELPVTTLADYCYQYMFYGCTSLTTAPVLPATTLAIQCYSNMFKGCTSLTTAPVLPATTLANNCYSNMFQGCSSLNYIKAMFTTEPNSTYTSNWVSGVASTGTFVKNSAATWNVTGTNGVPSGWTVETASA